MSQAEIEELVASIASRPNQGDEISGTVGCRKVRRAGPGKGKSGEYRVITLFSGSNRPVFLITVFSKGERSDLSKTECNQLKKITEAIVDQYRARVEKVS